MLIETGGEVVEIPPTQGKFFKVRMACVFRARFWYWENQKFITDFPVPIKS